MTFTFTMTQTDVPCALLEVALMFMGKALTGSVGGCDDWTAALLIQDLAEAQNMCMTLVQITDR